MTVTEPRTMPRHLLTAAVPFALGATAVWASLDLGTGSLTNPGPGLWPALVGASIMLGSGAILIAGSDGEPFVRRSWHVLIATLALIGFVVLFQTVGFVLPALLILAFWLRVISKESWRMTAGVTVGATVVLYVLFEMLLGVPFPFDIVTGR